jgi:hypothetical protein
MARTPEAAEKVKVKAYLTSLWCYQFWPVPSGYGRQGVDCYACVEGRFFAIEVKAPGQKPTPRQIRTLEEVDDAEGIAIWGTADQIISVIQSVLRQAA